MSEFWKLVAFGVVAVLTFDTVASFASIEFSFSYTYASVGSVLIYGTIGYITFRRYGFPRAIGAALLVELVDATLGWFISWQIGPGALPIAQATPVIIATSIVFVLLFAAVCALVGAAIARVLHGRRLETNA